MFGVVKVRKIHMKTQVPESLFLKICRRCDIFTYRLNWRFYLKKILRVHVKDKTFNRSSCLRCSMKKGVIRKPATLWKETLAQVFSCEFCKISKNTFFTEHLWSIASVTTVMKACNFIKKRLEHRCFFLWIFQNFWDSFFIELRWLLLNYVLVSERIFNKET